MEDYTKPEISDYGDVKDLTASTTLGKITDVPKGSPVATSL
jgi:hypothetical protein